MLTDVAEPMTPAEPASAPKLAYLIKRIEMVQRARMEEALRPLGVPLNQYTALSLLERRQLSSAQLARRHYVTPQAMNQLVATMERDGLIERRPDPHNRRVLRAALTDRGTEVLGSCHAAVEDLENEVLAAFAPAEAEQFRRSLGRALTALTEMST
jgi:DNA-binding MarR family transcriptional regulator